eukprot:216700-Pleurochrysis_carterae.AAC.1
MSAAAAGARGLGADKAGGGKGVATGDGGPPAGAPRTARHRESTAPSATCKLTALKSDAGEAGRRAADAA